MKKHLILCLLLAFAPAFVSHADAAEPVPSAAVKMVDAHINLQPFHSISTDVLGGIRFCPSDRYRIEATGPERIIRAIDVKVENGVLRINVKKDAQIKMRQGEKLHFVIYGQSLSSLRLDGVGNFKCSDAIRTDTLEIMNTGVGNIRLEDLQCRELIVKNEGVGNITLKGRADKATYMSDGVGNIYAYDLQSRAAVVSLNGLGSVQCHSSESADYTSNGIGHIYYKGNPPVQRIHKNGLGAISRR